MSVHQLKRVDPAVKWKVNAKRQAKPYGGKRQALTRTSSIGCSLRIEKLIKAAGENRWGHRDATAILIANRGGRRLAT